MAKTKRKTSGAAREAARRRAAGPSVNERLLAHVAVLDARFPGQRITPNLLILYAERACGWPVAELVRRLDEGWIPRGLAQTSGVLGDEDQEPQTRAGAPVGGGRSSGAPGPRRQSPKVRRKRLVRSLRESVERVEKERQHLEHLLDRRDELVRRLRADGASWAEVEAVAGLSRVALTRRARR